MDIDKLVEIAIKNNFNENTICEIVLLYFGNECNYDKVRIGISEDIFNLFMKYVDEKNEFVLKLKDAKFKDKIMKAYIIRNKSQ